MSTNNIQVQSSSEKLMNYAITSVWLAQFTSVSEEHFSEGKRLRTIILRRHCLLLYKKENITIQYYLNGEILCNSPALVLTFFNGLLVMAYVTN